MPDADLARFEAAFLEACDLSAGDRTAFINSFSADPAARNRLRALLEHDASARADFLAGEPTTAQGLYHAGYTIGRYRLDRLIGAGGFGEVWLAEQVSPVRRAVALKIIKPGMDTRELIARFESERQTLALLDHPAIAKVFDAGATEQGRPYFVMEYVAGAPITRYCRDHHLDISQRLRLFLDVCAGVQHAHHKGVIHRDLKPSNILVRDTAPGAAADSSAPVIIDFGIAKTVQSALNPDPALTGATRGLLLGTPEYMSPEQAALPGAPAPDTRSDIYSLGVVLYELLVGAQPFRRSGALDPASLRRRILEDTPLRPSSRALDHTPASDHPEPDSTTPRERRALRDRLRGDLDWIVLRALEKEPARRYSSVAELAADIRRHLAHEPVLAGPPSIRYRASKFIRRHRAAAVSIGAIVAMLMVATVLSTRFALSEASQRRLAQRQAAVAFLAAAHAALADENQPLALKNLDLVPPELRGWEWDHLRQSADPALYHLPPHDGVRGVVTSADRSTLYTLDSRGQLRAWDIHNGAPRSTIDLEAGFGDLVAVDPARALVLTWAADQATAFDLRSGRALWRAHGGRAALRPGSSQVVYTAPNPARLVVADVLTGETRSLPIAAPYLRTTSLVDPSGRFVITQTYGDAVVLSLDDARVIATPEARSAAWHSDAEHPQLVTVLGGNREPDRVYLVDLATQQRTPLNFPPVVQDTSIVLAPDARSGVAVEATRARLLHAGIENSVAVTRLSGIFRAAVFDATSRIAVIAGAGGDIAAYDAARLPLNRATSLATLQTNTAAISPNAGLVARGKWGDIGVWNTSTGAPVWRTVFSRAALRAIAWGAEGDIVAAVTVDHELTLFDARDGQVLDRTTLPILPAWIALPPGRARVYFGGPAGVAFAAGRSSNGWTFSPIALSHAAPTAAAALTGDGARLAILGVATATSPAALDLFDTTSLTRPRWSALSTTLNATALQFSDDAQTLWAATDRDSLIAFNVSSGSRVGRYSSGLATFTAVSARPGSDRLAALAADGTLTIWSTRTGDAMSVWPNAAPIAVRFTPDGRDLVLSCIEHPVIRLETRPEGANPARLAAVRAAALAERLDNSPLASDVVARVRASADPPEVIAAAVDHLGRLGDSINQCNSEAWRIALTVGASPAYYDTALRAVDAATRAFPDDGGILNTRALVLFRLKRWEDAIADARRSDELLISDYPDGVDVNAAIVVMALRASGRGSEAGQELDRLNAMVSRHPVDGASQAAALVEEARRAMSSPQAP